MLTPRYHFYTYPNSSKKTAFIGTKSPRLIRLPFVEKLTKGGYFARSKLLTIIFIMLIKVDKKERKHIL